jgi:UDP-glucose 4-epimerase
VALYLVTGGAGFVGSHLVQKLQDQGHKVRILDDFSTGKISSVKPATEVFRADVCDQNSLRKAMKGVSACFHLAAIADVQRCNSDWLGSHRVNVGGTISVFDVAAELGGIPVVWASSAAVYGSGGNEKLLSETSAVRPINPYGADKLASEIHGQSAASLFGVPNIGLRFFNIFGPGQDPNSSYSGVLSIFASQVLHRQPVTIFGDGHQTRDFIYINDIVCALIASAARLEQNGTDTQAHVYNVCTGQATSLLDIVTELDNLLGQKTKIEFKSARLGDIRTSCGDPTAMQAALGIYPRVSLTEGLQHLMETFYEQASLAS